MILKMFRAVWFLSVLVVLANLLYVYASLPEVVVIRGDKEVSLSKEWVFYIALAMIVVINILVYLVKMMVAEGEELRAWFHGLIITLNIFVIMTLQTIHLHTSNEMFNHNLVRYYLLGSLTLVIIWAAAWPVYLIAQRFFIKQTV